MKQTTTLMILDGFGYSEKTEGNAIAAASALYLDIINILLRVMPALSGGKPITVVTPSKLQLAQLKVKWERHVDKANILYASPYGDKAALERACREITETDGELVVLDCIGYTQKMKHDIAAATGKRVILARTMLARAVLEMIDA